MDDLRKREELERIKAEEEASRKRKEEAKKRLQILSKALGGFDDAKESAEEKRKLKENYNKTIGNIMAMQKVLKNIDGAMDLKSAKEKISKVKNLMKAASELKDLQEAKKKKTEAAPSDRSEEQLKAR